MLSQTRVKIGETSLQLKKQKPLSKQKKKWLKVFLMTSCLPRDGACQWSWDDCKDCRVGRNLSSRHIASYCQFDLHSVTEYADSVLLWFYWCINAQKSFWRQQLTASGCRPGPCLQSNHQYRWNNDTVS